LTANHSTKENIMESYKTENAEHLGFKIEIECHFDNTMGPPWEEHDGHGLVSGWERREAAPGERALGFAGRFYDVAGTLKVAARDGWGLSDKEHASLAAKLGRTPTSQEIIARAVDLDFAYLCSWCNGGWYWIGYIAYATGPAGVRHEVGSCWGFDDEAYMLKEALGDARSWIENQIKTKTETEIAECVP
jgi:hypothetical protein